MSEIIIFRNQGLLIKLSDYVFKELIAVCNILFAMYESNLTDFINNCCIVAE